MDDTHTLHLWYHVIVPPAELTIPAHLAGTVHTYDVPYTDERGGYFLDSIHAQDIMAWITQGPIADRSLEALGSTDRGVTVYRNMLRRELKRIENGEDPMNVFRGAEPETMELPLEFERTQGDLSPDGARGEGFAITNLRAMFSRHEGRFCPLGPEIVDVFVQHRQREPAGVA
jgi:5,5'-dehydrodivanillate O-demethylase